MNLGGQKYRVLYCKKSDKKRKTYQDGILHLLSECMTLTDDDGKEIYKKKGCAAAIELGVDIILGSFELQIEEAVDALPVSINTTMAAGYVSHTSTVNYVSHSSTSKPFPSTRMDSFPQKKIRLDPPPCSRLTEKIEQKKTVKTFVSSGSLPVYKNVINAPLTPFLSSASTGAAQTTSHDVSSLDKSCLPEVSVTSSSTTDAKINSNGSDVFSTTILTSSDIVLDNALVRMMRPHQIDGANFLIKRLLGEHTTDIVMENVIEACSTSNKSDSVPTKRCSKFYVMKGALSDTDDDDDDDDSPDLQSDSDSDDECFKEKPPSWKAPSTSGPKKSAIYTGAILADEVY